MFDWYDLMQQLRIICLDFGALCVKTSGIDSPPRDIFIEIDFTAVCIRNTKCMPPSKE